MSTGNKINLLPGDYVFREGEFGQTAFIIETGTIELVKYTGEEHTLSSQNWKKVLFLVKWQLSIIVHGVPPLGQRPRAF